MGDTSHGAHGRGLPDGTAPTAAGVALAAVASRALGLDCGRGGPSTARASVLAQFRPRWLPSQRASPWRGGPWPQRLGHGLRLLGHGAPSRCCPDARAGESRRLLQRVRAASGGGGSNPDGAQPRPVRAATEPQRLGLGRASNDVWSGAVAPVPVKLPSLARARDSAATRAGGPDAQPSGLGGRLPRPGPSGLRGTQASGPAPAQRRGTRRGCGPGTRPWRRGCVRPLARGPAHRRAAPGRSHDVAARARVHGAGSGLSARWPRAPAPARGQPQQGGQSLVMAA